MKFPKRIRKILHGAIAVMAVMTLGGPEDGRTQLFQDGELILDEVGSNIVTAEGLERLEQLYGGPVTLSGVEGIDNIQVGITIGTGPQELLTDNVRIWLAESPSLLSILDAAPIVEG